LRLLLLGLLLLLLLLLLVLLPLALLLLLVLLLVLLLLLLLLLTETLAEAEAAAAARAAATAADDEFGGVVVRWCELINGWNCEYFGSILSKTNFDIAHILLSGRGSNLRNFVQSTFSSFFVSSSSIYFYLSRLVNG